LFEHYYEVKIKDLFELKLGTMTMEEYEKQLFELLKYVDFIKDDEVKNPKVSKWVTLLL
jgi:hypothetical protein